MRFKLEEVVRLKSGGPLMTVDRIDDSQAHCKWYNGQRQVGGWFELAALVTHNKTDDN